MLETVVKRVNFMKRMPKGFMIDSLGEDLRMVLDKNLFMNLNSSMGKDIECDLMDKLYNKILRSDIYRFKNNMLRVVFLNLKSKGIYVGFFR
jgi:hypothetical protein